MIHHRHIKAPNRVPLGVSCVFLAGSIEMGEARDWQAQIADILAPTPWSVLNPRRDDWDSTWEQSIENEKFCEQVRWELAAMEHADRILMYFDPKTKAPITLLELGLFADSGKLIVVCPDGFYRKGNVQIVCQQYGIPMAGNLQRAVELLNL